MFGKKLMAKLVAVTIAVVTVIGCGATVLADERITPVENRNLYFRRSVSTQTTEFVPECTGEYIFESIAPEASASRYVNPLIEVRQNGNRWLDFNSADGLNFKLRVHLEGGVPCNVFVQCDGYYNTANVLLKISRVENEPEVEEDEIPDLTEEQIDELKDFVREIMIVAYADDPNITEEDIDEAMQTITVKEMLAICNEFGYTI